MHPVITFSLWFTLASAALAQVANPSATPPDAMALKPHHTATGFKNNYVDHAENSGADLFRWQVERFKAGLPRPPLVPTPTVQADLAFIQRNASPANMVPAATWVGHATMMVQMGGLTVLTDPVFSERASPVQFAGPKRAQPPGLRLDQLPPIDVVVLSHNHYDHLDKNTVLALAKSNAGGKSPLFLVPLKVKAWFNDLGIDNVKELDWWDSVVVPNVLPNGQAGDGVAFHFTPVQHWSARAWGDKHQTLWGGWAVFAPDLHWYFSGDTGYSQDFADTRAHFAKRQTAALGGGFDLALIAVGAYEPRWFMSSQHVNPEEAVRIHKDLDAKRSIGVHWGTFELTDESLDQPPKDLAVARQTHGLKDDDFSVMAIGETRRLAPRPKPAP